MLRSLGVDEGTVWWAEGREGGEGLSNAGSNKDCEGSMTATCVANRKKANPIIRIGKGWRKDGTKRFQTTLAVAGTASEFSEAAPWSQAYDKSKKARSSYSILPVLS